VAVAVLLAASVIAAILLARAATVTPPSGTVPTETLTPSATPFSPHVPPRTLPTTTGRVVASPQSTGALPGVAYAVRLLAPCALVIDFDGSFWTSPPGFRLLKPTQPATVTLVRSGRAVLRTGGGQTVELVKTPAPVTLPACAPSRSARSGALSSIKG
jgi:hypothetical protein